MQNVDLEASLVAYVCLEGVGVNKLLKEDGRKFKRNLNIKIQL